MTKYSASAQAIIYMLLSMACFSAMNILIHRLAGSMHSMQMVFIRNAFSLFLVVGFAIILAKGTPNFTTDRLPGHFGRAMMGLLAMQLWFYSVTVMPVTLATALNFTTPIFVTIFAILFLKERAGLRRWGALLVSFLGVWLIADPDVSQVDAHVLYVLAASAAMAVAGVFVKSLSRTEAPETIVFYMVLFMTPVSLPFALLYWQPLTHDQLYSIAGIAVFSTAAQLMIARAFKRADMVVLMPFDFTRLVFTAFFAYILFGEVLNTQAWVGAVIIVVSTVYIAHREARQKRLATK